MRVLALAAVTATWFLGATAARAASVLIVKPANGPPVMIETLVRLKGELTSAGFQTEIVEGLDAGGASRAGLEQLAARRGADAVVAIVGDLAPDSVEVWVIDKVTGKSVVRRVPFEPTAAQASKTLAIRAIELLRSSFLEIDLAARDRQDERNGEHRPPPPAVVRFVEMQRPAGPAERFGVEVGAAAFMSLDGVGPALLPLVRFDWSLDARLLAQAALAGLGTRPSVDGAAGSAQVAQGYGLVGGGFRFRPGMRLRPFVALSAGVLRTAVEGHADAPANQGHAADQWSFLLDAGLGALLRLPDRFYSSLAIDAQVAEPYPAVRFVDTTVATSGRPNLLFSLAVGAWL